MFIQVLGVLQETFSSFRVLMGLEIYDTMNPVETGRKLNVHKIYVLYRRGTTGPSDRAHHLNIRKQKPYKILNVLNIKC